VSLITYPLTLLPPAQMIEHYWLNHASDLCQSPAKAATAGHAATSVADHTRRHIQLVGAPASPNPGNKNSSYDNNNNSNSGITLATGSSSDINSTYGSFEVGPDDTGRTRRDQNSAVSPTRFANDFSGGVEEEDDDITGVERDVHKVSFQVRVFIRMLIVLMTTVIASYIPCFGMVRIIVLSCIIL
jgi:hypothetical protein